MLKFKIIETGNVTNRYDLLAVLAGGTEYICFPGMTRAEAMREAVRHIKDGYDVTLRLVGPDGPVRTLSLGKGSREFAYECRDEWSTIYSEQFDYRMVRWHNTVCTMLGLQAFIINARIDPAGKRR